MPELGIDLRHRITRFRRSFNASVEPLIAQRFDELAKHDIPRAEIALVRSVKNMEALEDCLGYSREEIEGAVEDREDSSSPVRVSVVRRDWFFEVTIEDSSRDTMRIVFIERHLNMGDPVEMFLFESSCEFETAVS